MPGEPKPIEYPTNWGTHTNLVASGLPVYAPGGMVQALGVGTPSADYGLYYDVYLIDGPDSSRDPYCRYVYEFVYWSSKIRRGKKDGVTVTYGQRYLQQFDGTAAEEPDLNFSGASVPYLKSWKPGPGTASIQLNSVNNISSYANPAGPLLYKTNSVKKMRNANASVLPDLSGKVPTTPINIGWTNLGKGPLYTPKQGPGGGPYYSTTGGVNQDYANDPGVSDSTGNTGGNGPGGDAGTDTAPPRIPGFDKKRVTYWNPPLISTATGAYVGVSVDSQYFANEPDSRSAILGTGTRYQRQMRKGTIIQNIVGTSEWVIQGSDASTASTTTTTTDGKKKKKGSTTAAAPGYNVGDPAVPNGVRYGFRFHYNPAEISFTAGYLADIDPAVFTSGLEKAFPVVGADGATINLTLYLNRIEDMSFIDTAGPGKWKPWKDLYGGKKLTEEDFVGLATRGTGYDLEFLYRTAMGQPWPTRFRGITADLGIIIGLPLVINLGGNMRYQGRLSSLQYTHLSFTQNMVPMFTVVNLSFARVPDSPTTSSGKKKKHQNQTTRPYDPVDMWRELAT